MQSKKKEDTLTEKDFSKSLMYLIHTMTFLTEKHLEKKLLQTPSLTFSQFVILMGITCQYESSAKQSTLADFLHITEATVSRHIKTLISEGFLIKTNSPINKKEKILSLSPHGQKAFMRSEQIVSKTLEEIFSPLKESDKKNLHTYFEVLLNSPLLTKER